MNEKLEESVSSSDSNDSPIFLTGIYILIRCGKKFSTIRNYMIVNLIYSF